jgi:uracil phosphoribosyltransferase
VTTLDVEDSDIELLTFGPQAEMMVKRRISSWEAQSLDSSTMFVLRMATIYQTACLMARSFVRGGTIGLARPLSTGEGRDWEIAAEAFCNKYEYWVNIADQSDPDAENNTDFTVDPMVISGPTSVRIARRSVSSASSDPDTASWWQYPPLWK